MVVVWKKLGGTVFSGTARNGYNMHLHKPFNVLYIVNMERGSRNFNDEVK